MHEHEKLHLRSTAAFHLGLAGAHKVELVVLPAAQTRPEPVSNTRRLELAESIDEAFYARTDRTKIPEVQLAIDDAAVEDICRTCRGSCCKAGENHAFLTRAVLERVKKAHKWASKAVVLQSYLKLVPEAAYADSCIYHTEHGCALPRSMRSETCNRYICVPLQKLSQSFGMPGYAQLAVAAAADRNDAQRMLLLSDRRAQPFVPESSCTKASGRADPSTIEHPSV